MSLHISENIPLAEFTTFKIGGPARFFTRVTTEGELAEAIQFARAQKLRFMMLGGGSNILIADSGHPGLVIKNEIMGKQIISENDREVIVRVGAGEQWDSFVEYAVSQGWYGIENLSAIPGTVGATPVQNIGAYGVEVSSVIHKVRAYDATKKQVVELSRAQCAFEYRDSIFKKKKGRYSICSVDFILVKQGTINMSYRDVTQYFDQSPTAPTLAGMRNAIIDIRWKKLPDWRLWGTAGSYFKNPVVTSARYDKLREKYPELPGFTQSDGRIKVSAAWIIDKVCNLRGVMTGNVGSYEHQALAVISKPGAKAGEVVAFAKQIMDCVESSTGIKLEAEVEWVN